MAAVFVFLVILTALIPLCSVIFGGIPFWHDPARDMLMAWDNLTKITLIGPPGGLPGVFYGPYWIWLLSWPMIFTRDPRFVVLFSITLPSLILFAVILWKLRFIFGTAGVFIIWTLFIVNFDNYFTFPWSPYLASLVFLALFYLQARRAPAFLIGAVSALTPNFNFSFGVTVIFASAVYQLLTNFRKIPYFLAGALVIYSPVILFEMRHGFLQTRSIFNAFVRSAVYGNAVVGQIGMAKEQIFSQLLDIPLKIFHLPGLLLPVIVGVPLILIVQKKLWKNRLMVFLWVAIGSMLLAYTATKNPVWPYYFIGAETVVLLMLGLVLAKSRIITIFAGLLAITLFVNAFRNFLTTFPPKFLEVPSLASKENIVRSIITDAGANPYQVFAYSPAIYTPDYDYLLKWLGKVSQGASLIYLIIPEGTSQPVKEDYIHYKTNDEEFKTSEEKTFPDGTTVIKRLKKT